MSLLFCSDDSTSCAYVSHFLDWLFLLHIFVCLSKNVELLHLLINHFPHPLCSWDVCWSIVLTILPSLCIVGTSRRVDSVCDDNVLIVC